MQTKRLDFFPLRSSYDTILSYLLLRWSLGGVHHHRLRRRLLSNPAVETIKHYQLWSTPAPGCYLSTERSKIAGSRNYWNSFFFSKQDLDVVHAIVVVGSYRGVTLAVEVG